MWTLSINILQYRKIQTEKYCQPPFLLSTSDRDAVLIQKKSKRNNQSLNTKNQHIIVPFGVTCKKCMRLYHRGIVEYNY
jgi:hypothetical protein